MLLDGGTGYSQRRQPPLGRRPAASRRFPSSGARQEPPPGACEGRRRPEGSLGTRLRAHRSSLPGGADRRGVYLPGPRGGVPGRSACAGRPGFGLRGRWDRVRRTEGASPAATMSGEWRAGAEPSPLLGRARWGRRGSWGTVGAGGGRACPGGPRRSAACSVWRGPVPRGPRPLSSPVLLPGGAGGCSVVRHRRVWPRRPRGEGQGSAVSRITAPRSSFWLPKPPRSGVLLRFKSSSLPLSVTLAHSTSDDGLGDFCCLNGAKSQEIFPRI